MTSLPQQDKKCPDCGGLPGLYPNNQCPVCYVKAQHDPSLNPQVDNHLNNGTREKLNDMQIEGLGVGDCYVIPKQRLIDFINQEKAKLLRRVDGEIIENTNRLVDSAVKNDPSYIEIVHLTGTQGIWDIGSRVKAEQRTQLRRIKQEEGLK